MQQYNIHLGFSRAVAKHFSAGLAEIFLATAPKIAMSWSHEVNFTNFALKSQHIFLATLDQKPSGGHILPAQHVGPIPCDQSYEVDGRRRSD